MFTAYNITSSFKFSSSLILSTLFIFNQSAQANLPMSNDGGVLKLANSVTAKTSKPQQQNTSKHSRYTVTLKDNVVYINNLRLGMPDNAAKDVIKKLNYKMYNETPGQFNAYNDKDSVRAKLRQGKLRSISTNEHYVQIDVENYINKLKASFGDKITCVIDPRRNSCNYVHREQGKFTSLTITFNKNKRDKKDKYMLSILLK